MSKPRSKAPAAKPPASRKARGAGRDALFDRIVSILEQARGNVARAVNTNMVLAYWLIGREIVEEIQRGKGRAKYGEKVIEEISARLTGRYGKGFSITNIWYFRQFYLAFHDRCQIPHPLGGESSDMAILHPLGGESQAAPIPSPVGRELAPTKSHLPDNKSLLGFSPQLSWSHYRALMRVENREARDFYEHEAIAGGWDKRTLERQIITQYYERCLHSQQPEKIIAEGRKLQKMKPCAADTLKNPYVLEFLGYPNFAELRESDLETAIITHLQRFLLELGNGFAFVARQKHIRIEENDRFIDLVFYHCRLKFYLLIDLKLGKLSHEDVGQMDGYVRMFDGLFTALDDNPTIGLILCTEKSDTVARYSVLNDRKQIFASKYLPNLPSEEQLRLEINRERRLIEAALEERRKLPEGRQS
ncbi:MAG TPA: PDDEXK nuclease domain-containing protein [Candidatus Sumerlaeota bacterium]|nr:PDDEXK nuclease domain-containing protein [Candidatus Sumerlaeota bacterium]HON49912.1 PDDEXK nuclease domain-containing protein [Candidatus Sumerlaeota bacterium]HOR63840.1 PDDEXK nuclease domain-containing protein [Candidatus Sumerlaeota bacterium]HPL74408.1 PDDEXK nuclease domain-containing protein [Candidatus Sumerlaeota bacterium]HRU54458.1 PDDEXK nuclease domain-containing protein [Candidatus Sumerlaeia bacterium]